MTVLLLLGLALGELLPMGRSITDRMAVVAAREVVLGSLHRTRMEAVAGGGASLVLVTTPPVLRIVREPSGEILDERALEDGVTLHLSRERAEAVLTFDAMGFGRVTSQTLTLRRGGAESSLVVSSLGRVRWE
jgi:hypothetical protein